MKRKHIFRNSEKKECLRAGIKRRLLLVAAVSLLVWTAAVCQQKEAAEDLFANQTAWWGGLYPGMVMKDALRLVGGDSEEIYPDTEIPVRIKWKCLDLLF